jgi:hypothetical protein
VGVRKYWASLRAQLFWQFIAETTLLHYSLLAYIVWAELGLPYLNNYFVQISDQL